jgi:hypothetical protein
MRIVGIICALLVLTPLAPFTLVPAILFCPSVTIKDSCFDGRSLFELMRDKK